MPYSHAPNLTGNWYCLKCGLVPDEQVYRVPSPVDDVFNHRVLDPFGSDTGGRHHVARYNGDWRHR